MVIVNILVSGTPRWTGGEYKENVHFIMGIDDDVAMGFENEKQMSEYILDDLFFNNKEFFKWHFSTFEVTWTVTEGHPHKLFWCDIEDTWEWYFL